MGTVVASPVKKTSRYSELDSIRGIAAVVVVTYHYLAMWHSPSVFDQGWASFMYPLVAGHEAVILFFLLSGFVLALPFLGGDKTPYARFALRRVLRIYGPYLAALLLSVMGAYFLHRPEGFGRWSGKTWSTPVNSHLLLQHVLFLGNYPSNQFNLAFWSLITELRVSLIFPFLFQLVQRMKTRHALIFSIASSLFAIEMEARYPSASDTLITLQYVGVFICGILLARNIEKIQDWIDGFEPVTRISLLIAAFMLYHEGHRVSDIPFLWRFNECLIVAGASGFIILGINAATLRQGFFQFLGKISYSLYLVHGTVLFTLAALLSHRFSQSLMLIPFFVICISISYLFWACVENPFVQLSRAVSRATWLNAKPSSP